MAATFRCTAYPALRLRPNGFRLQFVGGRLVVDDDVAAVVAKFAEQRPHYGITREDEPEAPEPTREEQLRAMNVPALREILGEMELDTKGNKDALVERILEAEAADEPMTPEAVQAVLDQALELGILEEPMEASDTVTARIEEDRLILTFADESTVTIPDEGDGE